MKAYTAHRYFKVSTVSADWQALTSFPARVGTTNIVIPYALTNRTLFIRTTTER